MTTNERTTHIEPYTRQERHPIEPLAQKLPPLGGARFDWLATVVLVLLVSGAYVDGWAHNHGKVDNTFFTPWHAILYAGLLLVGLFLGVNLLVNRRKGYPWRKALPAGYGASLFGVGVFGIGGVFDMIWHILFGIEVSAEALLSPTHLILGLGIVLMVTGPVRAAWLRLQSGGSAGWMVLMPMVICVALLLSLFAFFTQYAHPQVSVYSGKNTPYASTNLPTNLSVMSANGTLQTRLISNGLNHWDPAWSHDGKKIAFAAGPNTNNTYTPSQIYVANADGSNQVRLTNDTFDDWAPRWSSDDSKIVYTSNRDGDYKLYEMNADGSHQVNVSNDPGADNGIGGISWSRNGQLLYIVQEHPTVDPYFSQSLGVISILFQSVLLMSVVLFLLRYWSLPFGSMTVIFTLSSAFISVIADQYIFVAAAFAAGLIADVLLWWLKPSAARLVEFRICAFAVPMVFYSLYFLVVQLSGGINWSIHFWMGSIVLAGIIGLLLSYLLLPPLGMDQKEVES